MCLPDRQSNFRFLRKNQWLLSPSIIGIPRQLDIHKRPFPPTSVRRTGAVPAILQTGLPLEFHEPGGGLRFATWRRFNPADDVGVRPQLVRVGDGGRIGQVGTQLLERCILGRLVEVGTQFGDRELRAFLCSVCEHVVQLGIRQDKSLQGFHERDFRWWWIQGKGGETPHLHFRIMKK
jgi:hypothetical protein